MPGPGLDNHSSSRCSSTQPDEIVRAILPGQVTKAATHGVGSVRDPNRVCAPHELLKCLKYVKLLRALKLRVRAFTCYPHTSGNGMV